jgi:hypothetical protein
MMAEQLLDYKTVAGGYLLLLAIQAMHPMLPSALPDMLGYLKEGVNVCKDGGGVKVPGAWAPGSHCTLGLLVQLLPLVPCCDALPKNQHHTVHL